MTETVPKTHHRSQKQDGTIKGIAESLTIAFILALVFRTFVAEAFVIPTGSMAPTLLGQHVCLTCPQCGHTFATEARDYNTSSQPFSIQGHVPGGNGQPLKAYCPMCHYRMTHDYRRLSPGDRIFVLKYIYAFSQPKRWDVVVFKNPENPSVNFIKRLVGLPDESLCIVNGNIYTRRFETNSNDNNTPWRIQRKIPRVQKVVWQPIYHSEYVRLDDSTSWSPPWTFTGDWKMLDGQRSYAFTNTNGRSGQLSFKTSEHIISDYYSYNSSYRRNPGIRNIVEDLRIGATFVPRMPSLAVTLRIDTEAWSFRGVVRADGTAVIETRKNTDEANKNTWITQCTANEPIVFIPNHDTRIELAHVDSAVQLRVDDKCVAHWQYDDELTSDELTHRLQIPPMTQPTVTITVNGAPVRLNRINLDRDLYYTQIGERATRDVPVHLDTNEFFCLGDNSPHSSDGRRWDSVDPWVLYYTRTVDENGNVSYVQNGVVPRDLMVGKAFFVYLRRPLRLEEDGYPVIPNFGTLQFIN